jgi:NADH:ubiquinone oxidoreductase subunit 3 (subunit A)
VGSWLLVSPIVFVVLLVAAGLLYRLLGTLSLPAPAHPGSGRGKAYACGEDVKGDHIQPEYSQFFPFAFFFTIMHVFALVVATVPAGDLAAMAMAVCYTIGAVIGLFILFRE